MNNSFKVSNLNNFADRKNIKTPKIYFLGKDNKLYPENSSKNIFRIINGNVPEKVEIPGVTRDFNVGLDIYMIGDLHLLIVPKKKCCSLYQSTKITENQALQSSIKAIIKNLQRAYPNRNIYFVEHGSGFLNKKKTTCGTSLSVIQAHGHFFVPPFDKQPNFQEVEKKVNQALKDVGWKDLSKRSVKNKSLIPPCYERIFNKTSNRLGQKVSYDYPYLHVGMVKPSGEEVSRIYIKKSPEEQTPSQLMRKIMSDLFYGEKPEVWWDWKKALQIKESGISDLNLRRRLNNISKARNDFKNRLMSTSSKEFFA
ncbi:MAG: hypothetical protein A2287_08635 [Candidatus Melainabacteria bacterium RIFOXYA12_FULL_32_12]|nr:MAG: hypothetical protein A2255_01340 [Candidatus Melainabacteria bacterium RIFOXYA2_FULL_32_9]OGI30447.1 MAG: hypothetical protein A2287_08635 [Candidatus Melainabacteria bacterium RIFOXYA12_FULL_32_12]